MAQYGPGAELERRTSLFERPRFPIFFEIVSMRARPLVTCSRILAISLSPSLSFSEVGDAIRGDASCECEDGLSVSPGLGGMSWMAMGVSGLCSSCSTGGVMVRVSINEGISGVTLWELVFSGDISATDALDLSKARGGPTYETTK